MVTFLTGFPGSGKSYYEIEKIYNIMSRNHQLSKSIQTIFTNINGIKFNLFPQNGIELKKLNIEVFYTYLAESYALYETFKNSDDVDKHLIKHSKEKGFFNCLIAFDECHDFLANQDKIKVYWLTYHRHLHHEIDLLTQNKSLINSKYRAIPEIFIEAQPRSKKLFSNTLSYKHFASFSMRKSDQFNKSSIKTKKEIFNLYGSGNTSKQKSILIKFIFIAIIGLFFASFLFYLLFHSLNNKNKEINKKEKVSHFVEEYHSNKSVNKTIVDDNISLDSYVIEIIFDSREGYFFNNKYYSNFHFRRFIKETNSKILSKYSLITNKNYRLIKLYVRTNDKALKHFFIVPKPKEESNPINKIKVNL